MADNSADSTAAKGPSKKELNKLARKEKKKTGNNAGDTNAELMAAKYSVLFTKGYLPELTRIVELYLEMNGVFKYFVNKTATEPHMPLMKSIDDCSEMSGTLSFDANIAEYLVRTSPNEAASALLGGNDAWRTCQVHQWLDLYDRGLYTNHVKETFPAVLNAHVADRTYLVGDSMTLADMAMWTVLRKANFNGDTANLPHTSRWYELVSSDLPTWSPIPISVLPVTADTSAANASASSTEGKKKGGKDASGSGATSHTAATEEEKDGAAGTCPPLENAVDGQVCTRFPPEPSGYLHIGK